MKNAAVKSMIAQQFLDVNPNDISVEFMCAQGWQEHYQVKFVDEDLNYRKFELKIEMKEILDE